MLSEISSSLDYIRRYYNVPAYQGQQVTYRGDPAVVVGAKDQYLKLRFQNQKATDPRLFHPTWKIEYC